jgi:hypothetical protein
MPAAARAGVSSACTAGAAFSSSRTRCMNPLASTSAAAFPRIPAIQPMETAVQASWHSMVVDEMGCGARRSGSRPTRRSPARSWPAPVRAGAARPR